MMCRRGGRKKVEGRWGCKRWMEVEEEGWRGRVGEAAGCHVQPAAAGAHGNKMETTARIQSEQNISSHLINVGGEMIN